ncbi:MAG: phosphogluconate dehydratase [Betaproteobacteria bacterium AqS2]|uniref:Phosphogluconate dehydratase n=1 Tax=Candidatus Amphirhobacter heronislandensis TaxID=1732024 RepID=A0A930XXX0_9GAMM|nr:phosphogluconate dehydratase [Betaproteobacteria bacterium AqS2]
MHPQLKEVTARIAKRSAQGRAAYLKQLDAARAKGRVRTALSCSNLAHGFAACGATAKQRLSGDEALNIGVITAYNDMLSAHQPYERFPAVIRAAAEECGATAQVAGATPAMCDGVTQGQDGMQLSLFSRDVIALATAVGLSHAMFDAALVLGICDKIVPGQLIGALRFGHLPTLFVPGGPMRSGLDNKSKAEVRMRFAAKQATRIELLAAESASYHSPGTCTFYGTANSNQMFMELMGLHVPASTFVNPDDPLRDELTRHAVRHLAAVAGDEACALGRLIDERAVVNAVCGLLATGGSTNHTIHLVAIARAAGVIIDWRDFDELSACVPLLTRVYPNGVADVNHFRDAGGLAWVIKELAGAGLLHDDVQTMFGRGLSASYVKDVKMADGGLEFSPAAFASVDNEIVRPAAEPFAPTGGIRLMTGNLGRSVCKVSAVAPEHQIVEAPARIFADQGELLAALGEGLDEDFVAVVRFQGVRANGMPELHKLTPGLAVLQKKGRKVALVTDGRMSGASGTVPAAIHLSPEALLGGAIAKLRDGDVIVFDCEQRRLDAKVADEELAQREPAAAPGGVSHGCGRELFEGMRAIATEPEAGATAFGQFI